MTLVRSFRPYRAHFVCGLVAAAACGTAACHLVGADERAAATYVASAHLCMDAFPDAAAEARACIRAARARLADGGTR